MTIKPLFLALLLALTVFISCDKSGDNDPQPEENKIPLIKTETAHANGQPGVVKIYEYDQEGRIAKLTSGNSYISYRYEPGKVIRTRYPGENSQTSIDTLLLNDKGLLIAYEGFTYEYNALGYRILAPDFSHLPPWQALTLTIQNGNMVESTPKYWNEYVMVTNTYKFQAGLNTIGDENMGITWNGKQNQNLMSEEIDKTVTPSRTYERHFLYDYELDDKNRVTKKTVTDVEYDYVFYIVYTYY